MTATGAATHRCGRRSVRSPVLINSLTQHYARTDLRFLLGLIFLVYINELIYLLERHGIKVKMFADDVKMYLKIINDVDIVYLQAALTSLVEWANEWQLAISIEKCCVLNIGKQVPAPLIHLDNCSLPVVPLARDLGVLVSNILCPSPHINDIVAKAHKRAYMI